MTIKKEDLEQIKTYLEAYQEDLLKIKHRPAGQVVNIRVNISELVHSLNVELGNLGEVFKRNVEDRYMGRVMALKEEYPKKTSKEIIERLESLLCTTNLPSFELEPILFGLWELKERNNKKGL